MKRTPKFPKYLTYLRHKLSKPAWFLSLTGLTYLALSLYTISSPNLSHYLNNFLTSTTKFISQIPIPPSMREYVYAKYGEKYGVDMEECQKELKEYGNLGEFFTRGVKEREQYQGYRGMERIVTVPCDGQIMSIQRIQGDQVIAVKDIKYSLSKLLFNEKSSNSPVTPLLSTPSNSLFLISIYLSPGNYHHFHSPVPMRVVQFRPISGQLKPVNLSSLLKHGSTIYEQNARKILHGRYLHPIEKKDMYVGMVMIGALNVGDIVMYDSEKFGKCQEIGYFGLGSTVVMLLETGSRVEGKGKKEGEKIEAKVKWFKKVGDNVRFGDKLCQFVQ